MRKLEVNIEAAFEPAASFSIYFPDGEVTFQGVTKAMRALDGSIYLEFLDESFAEIKMPYNYYRVGIDE